MKIFNHFFSLLLMVAIIMCVGCPDTDTGTETEDPLETQAALLSGTWTTSSVTYQGAVAPEDWSNFTLTISNATSTGGDYNTSGVPAGSEDVWADTGTWTFANSSGTIITRAASNNAGAVDIVVVVGETSLEMSFNNTGTVGRSMGIEGAWKFTMAK